MRWTARARKEKPKAGQNIEGQRRAEEALGESIMQKRRAQEIARPVARVSRSLGRIREDNHFAEMIEMLYQGRSNES